jgi:hypothetical protein
VSVLPPTQDESGVTFTTEPGSLQLYIPEIMEHFHDSFPLAAMMYPPGVDVEGSPQLRHLTSDVVTLTDTMIESAIIATTHWGDEGEGPREEKCKWKTGL